MLYKFNVCTIVKTDIIEYYPIKSENDFPYVSLKRYKHFWVDYFPGDDDTDLCVCCHKLLWKNCYAISTGAKYRK